MTNRKPSLSFPLACLLLVQTVCALTSTHASDVQLKDFGGDSANTSTGGIFGGRQRFTLTFDSNFGYDDNTLGQADTSTVLSTTAANRTVARNADENTSGSAFLNFSLGAGYTAANPRLRLTTGADVGVNYYFDRPGRDYDINGGLSAHLTYKLTPRVSLEASTYNAYESQGDYGATTLTNFNGLFAGGTRTAGTSAERDGDFFFTTDYVSATYQASPRLSLALSQTIVAFAYEDEPYSTDQDRLEEYTQFEFSYHLQPLLSLAADYRFSYIDYFGTNNDSYTHYLTGGLDYSFSPRLGGSFRAGVEFRVYPDTLGDETSPYFEGNLSYNLNRQSHLSYVAHYGIEESDVSALNSKSDTFRTGIDFEQSFTARISGYLGFYYAHSFNEAPVRETALELLNADGFSEDSFDVAVGGRFAFSRHLSAEIGYTHTTVLSDVDERAYDRNRVFAGIRLSY